MDFNLKRFEKICNIKPTFDVYGVSQSSNLKSNSIAFALKIDEELISALASIKHVIIFVPLETSMLSDCYKDNLIIECINPRLNYIKVAKTSFDEPFLFEDNHRLNYVHPSAKIGNSVKLSPFSYVGADCVIEDDCILFPGAIILDRVKIGKETRIGSGSTIGGKGYGFERDNGKVREAISFGGNPYRMPHFGGVIIGDNCEIGANTTVCAGAIEPTILEDFVMVDDHVHIAHNCKIRRGAAVVACAEVSGSVEVGEEAWISPNATVMQKVSIGARSVIGLGAVVLKSTPPESIIIGNPGKQLNK